jgi:D-alanine-D-alanine ligase
MKVAIIYNKNMTEVIDRFGIQNKEIYNQKTVKMVFDALEAGGHNVELIDGNMHVIEGLQAFIPRVLEPGVLEGGKKGIVFNMAYGIQGESRYTHIPALLEMLGIPYVGSNPSGHALALDKGLTKIIMQKHGIPTPRFWSFSGPEEDMKNVEYPVIAKPATEAVSYGVRVVDNKEDLMKAVGLIKQEFRQNVLVEQFIRGREFAVGLLGNSPVETFPVLEIDLEKDPDAIQTVDDKKKKPRKKMCPAELPEEVAKEMKKLSVAAFNALGLRDFSRADIRMDENYNIYLLEINSMASLGKTGSYVHAASKAGYSYADLINKMLDVAFIRYFADTKLLYDKYSRSEKTPLHIRIRGFLRSHQNQTQELLRKIVNLNTQVRNVEGVNSFSSLMKKHLTAMGFSFQVIPQVEIGNILFFTNSQNGAYDILLLSNLDNATKIKDHEFFQKSGHKFFGTGIWEHKGGVIVMISALQALRFTRILRKMKIGILLTSDDTLQGKFAKKVIQEKAKQAKYVLGLHGATSNGGLVTSRSGAAVYHVEMNLRKRDDPCDVTTATNVYYRFIRKCVDLSNAEGGLVVFPSVSIMESAISECHAYAQASISVRFNDIDLLKSIDKKIRDFIPKKRKNIIDFQIEGGQRRPPMKKTEKVKSLWQTIKAIAERLDIDLREEQRWSSADICFVENDKYIIDGLGPVGGKPPKDREYIIHHSLLERGALLAMTLRELSRGVLE